MSRQYPWYQASDLRKKLAKLVKSPKFHGGFSTPEDGSVWVRLLSEENDPNGEIFLVKKVKLDSDGDIIIYVE